MNDTLLKEGEIGRKNPFSKLAKAREMNLLLILLVFIIVMCFASPYFPHWSNISTLLSAMATDGIIVIGMTIILIVRGIDLSVGSVMCLTMAVCGKLFLMGLNPWVAAIIAICIAAAIGAGHGLLVTKANLSFFIVTLCTMGIVRGAVYVISGGTPVSIVAVLKEAPSFRFLGQGWVGGIIPMAVIIFVILVVVMEFVTRKSAILRSVFYVGSSEKAALYSGIKVDKVKILTCVACSVFAGIAGIIYLSKFSGVPMSAGQGTEMTAIAAAVIGGVSMNGGKGSVFGAILGLALMTLVQNALTLFNVQAFWQDLIRYAIVLGAVAFDGIQQKMAQSKLT